MERSEYLLPYHDHLAMRDPESVDLMVIHCTELPDLAMARDYAERIHYPHSGTGNAGHYYVDRAGQVHCWVRPTRVAHHVRGYNPRSIGIELVNRGRWPNWLDSGNQDMTEAYPDDQVQALIDLLTGLRAEHSGLRWIAGHDELDRERVPASDDPAQTVFRKRDPGPLFPWQKVLAGSALQRFPETERT